MELFDRLFRKRAPEGVSQAPSAGGMIDRALSTRVEIQVGADPAGLQQPALPVPQCPHCGHGFARPPQRGSSCKACGKRFVVRAGLVLTEEQGWEHDLRQARALGITPLLQQAAIRIARSRAPGLPDLYPDAGLTPRSAERVCSLIAMAIEAGLPTSRLLRPLQELGMSRDRAEAIARTETAEALGAGRQEVSLLEGRDEKRWVTSGAHVCPICLANEAQGWIKATALFQSGHSHVAAHVSCTCVCSYRTAALHQDA